MAHLLGDKLEAIYLYVAQCRVALLLLMADDVFL